MNPDDFTELLRTMLDKLKSVEGDLKQFGQEGLPQSLIGACAGHRGAGTSKMHSAALDVATKAVEVARDALILTSRVEEAIGRPKTWRGNGEREKSRK